jgi:hypothetical protein
MSMSKVFDPLAGHGKVIPPTLVRALRVCQAMGGLPFALEKSGGKTVAPRSSKAAWYLTLLSSTLLFVIPMGSIVFLSWKYNVHPQLFRLAT